jgi:hypothetical protein
VKTRTRLSKKDLARIFGITIFRNGNANTVELRRGYFTDDVLNKLGLSIEDYKKIRTFDKLTSEKICAVFDITEEDLSVIPELRK